MAPFNPPVAPVKILFRGRRKKDKEAAGVGAVALDNIIGRDHVSLGLGHLRPVLVDHTLGQEAAEGLLRLDQARIVEHLCDEARIEQVQHGMLDTADILIHRHPVIRRFFIKRESSVMRAGVA